MRISDWSSDVCSSDLTGPRPLANGADSMKRRTFVKAGLIGGAAAATTFAKPNIAAAQSKTFQWKLTNAYGPGSPLYVTGPGSPNYFCELVKKMSGGRLLIQHLAAGELIPALEGFDAVSKGTRSVVRGTGQDGVGTCRFGWTPIH